MVVLVVAMVLVVVLRIAGELLWMREKVLLDRSGGDTTEVPLVVLPLVVLPLVVLPLVVLLVVVLLLVLLLVVVLLLLVLLLLVLVLVLVLVVVMFLACTSTVCVRGTRSFTPYWRVCSSCGCPICTPITTSGCCRCCRGLVRRRG
jgi:hypothetical protein